MNNQAFNIRESVCLLPEHLSNEQLAALYKEQIPSVIARRCSQLSKMALAVSGQMLENNVVDYAVFCSQHGELKCALGLLTDLSRKALLSPARFTGSVHNSASGLFAIIHQMHQNMTSIAAGANSFLMGMVSALAWLKLHPDDQVLLVAFDDRVPVEYQSLKIPNDNQYAVALLLTAKDRENKGHLLTASVTDSVASLNHAHQNAPDALIFFDWLTTSQNRSFTQGMNGPKILWERVAL